jgi:hypothetical protein
LHRLQPVVLDGQFQKASYYDYSKQKLVKGVVKIAKDLPLMGLTFSLNSIHTPYVSELIKGVMGEWAASIELYQVEVMKDHTDINAYIAFKYQHLPKEERLGAFKTDAHMAALAPRTLTELRELRTALAGYLVLIIIFVRRSPIF